VRDLNNLEASILYRQGFKRVAKECKAFEPKMMLYDSEETMRCTKDVVIEHVKSKKLGLNLIIVKKKKE